eukprot:CAMPEP_0194291766 /NCGR_PEP_ID=MMETSP0169-20130528/44146_1 /TAXON_ID=218684 /ORGANISM="Corethron pennatum, Strain L29A3" /LENGTH=192 /DNA_ID=CAMNT_0039039753 /DNA_START=45 /DNA_END=619 /DNA_ORIENTATION=+
MKTSIFGHDKNYWSRPGREKNSPSCGGQEKFPAMLPASPRPFPPPHLPLRPLSWKESRHRMRQALSSSLSGLSSPPPPSPLSSSCHRNRYFPVCLPPAAALIPLASAITLSALTGLSPSGSSEAASHVVLVLTSLASVAAARAIYRNASPPSAATVRTGLARTLSSYARFLDGIACPPSSPGSPPRDPEAPP